MQRFHSSFFLHLALLAAAGCATRPAPQPDGSCELENPVCPEGQICEAVVDGEAQCVGPVVLIGRIIDATTDGAVAQALVQAVDVNGAPVGQTATTEADGSFELVVPVLRDAEGSPVEGSVTLRVQAATYERFPTPIRPALPIDLTTSQRADTRWVIENPLTTVKLLPLPGDTSQLGSISGSVSTAQTGGLLIVAESDGAGFIGYSDSERRYTIFNVPAGAYTVRGYARDVQLAPVSVTLAAAEEKTGVELTESDNPLSTVSGSVEIVDAPGGSLTSVILVVESTFNEQAGRGEAPPGLRVGDVATAFDLTGVPDGRYVVLAAFENDGLVRDPDQSIAGTQTVRIEIPDPTAGNTVSISEGFKVTGALAVVAPGADGPEVVYTPTPTFEWADDASEHGYIVRVFDAFGNEIWTEEIASVAGEETVSYVYPGPPLQDGLFYQFRATSFRQPPTGRSLISSTEDLTGVFQFVESP